MAEEMERVLTLKKKAKWDLLLSRSSFNLSEEQEVEGRVWLAEEMERVLTLKKMVKWDLLPNRSSLKAKAWNEGGYQQQEVVHTRGQKYF